MMMVNEEFVGFVRDLLGSDQVAIAKFALYLLGNQKFTDDEINYFTTEANKSNNFLAKLGLHWIKKENHQKAIDLYLDYIEVELIDAANNHFRADVVNKIALMFEKGQDGTGVPNYQKAIDLYRYVIALEPTDANKCFRADAMNKLASMLVKGQGCTKNDENDQEAMNFCQNVIALLDPTDPAHHHVLAMAMANRALMLECGRGCAKNEQEAICIYERTIALLESTNQAHNHLLLDRVKKGREDLLMKPRAFSQQSSGFFVPPSSGLLIRDRFNEEPKIPTEQGKPLNKPKCKKRVFPPLTFELLQNNKRPNIAIASDQDNNQNDKRTRNHR